MADVKALARRWFDEVWNRRNAGAIFEMMDGDCEGRGMVGPIRGPEEWRERQYAPFVDAFPDLHLEIEGVTGENDEAVVRWRATGTHGGAGLGFPATGKLIDLTGITWMRFRDGRIVEGRDAFDLGGMVQRLQQKE